MCVEHNTSASKASIFAYMLIVWECDTLETWPHARGNFSCMIDAGIYCGLWEAPVWSITMNFIDRPIESHLLITATVHRPQNENL